MLAQSLSTPELMISPDEGRDFTKACQNVMRHYSVQTTQKTMDWIALFGVSAAIYGPRFVAISANKRANRAPVQRRPPEGSKSNGATTGIYGGVLDLDNVEINAH